MKIAVISINPQGDAIAEKLNIAFSAAIYSKSYIDKKNLWNENGEPVFYEDFDLQRITERVMSAYEAVVFVSSTGIAVRAIAPYLKGKTKDPAVIVVDSKGKFVISLLSGHLGGANALALKVANVLEAQPVITTATDLMGMVAPDMIAKEHGLIIEDMKKAKEIAALLVNGHKVAFCDENKVIPLPKGYMETRKEAKALVAVTNKKLFLNVGSEKKEDQGNCEGESFEEKQTLRLIRKNIVLGIGCKKDFDSSLMQKIVMEQLELRNLDYRAVTVVATVEVKQNEKAILDLVQYFGCELKIISIEEIKKIQHRYEGSDFVEATIGARAVAEPCVELAGAKLLTERIAEQGMTLCIGEINM